MGEDRHDPERPRSKGQGWERHGRSPDGSGPRASIELSPGHQEHDGHPEAQPGFGDIQALDEMADASDEEQDQRDPPGPALTTGQCPGHHEKAEAGQDGDRRGSGPNGERKDVGEDLGPSSDPGERGRQQGDEPGKTDEERDDPGDPGCPRRPEDRGGSDVERRASLWTFSRSRRDVVSGHDVQAYP